MNALTFDVEEWFQVNSFREIVAGRWDEFESRITKQTQTVLSFLDEFDTKATFFVLGWVAVKQPTLVAELHKRGHEVGSHSFDHKLVFEQTPREFEEDLVKSLDAIEKACGVRPTSFRAPNFSITSDCLWALPILKKNGITIDSSIYPTELIHKNPVKVPQKPHQIEGLWELPGPTTTILGVRVPYGGGVFLRTQPYFFTKKAIKKANNKGDPIVVYIHPWELDPNHPKLNCSLKAKIVHYTFLSQTEKILRQLLEDFEFKPIRDVLEF